MKHRNIVLIVSIIIFSTALISFQFGQNTVQKSLDVFNSNYYSELPPNFDELLKKTYGESEYLTEINNIKISVEKIVNEKYFIVYSWVTGDKSYFAINLIIENTKKQELDKNDFQYLWIEDNLNESYFPLPYYRLIDFPPDQPLGWKQILFVKFTPLNEEAESINIMIKYKDEIGIIKDVPLN